MARILVIDDEPDTRTLLGRVLRHLGHECIAAANGEEGLEMLSASPLPDLLILDNMMPGINGAEVLRRLRIDQRTRDLPVIMYSAIGDPAFQQHMKDKGANAYWVKASMSIEQMGQALDQMLARQSRAW